MGSVDFKGSNIEVALRRLFWCFYMNGETQVIDRIMTDFSYEYFDQNVGQSIERESVYCYSFAIIF